MNTKRSMNDDDSKLYSLWRTWTILTFLLLIVGCGSPSWGPTIHISWERPKPELKSEIPLKYMGITVGMVQKVNSTDTGITIDARLYQKYAHYVREQSTFIFQAATANQPAYIEVFPLVKDALPVAEGAILHGAESRLEANLEAIATDWVKMAVGLGVSVMMIILLMLVIKLVFKLWALVMCIGLGAAGTIFLSPILEIQLRSLLPKDMRADLLAYILSFLAGCLLASIVLGIVVRPFRKRV